MSSFYAKFARFSPSAWYESGLTSRDEIVEETADRNMRRPPRFTMGKSLSATVLFAVASACGTVRADGVSTQPLVEVNAVRQAASAIHDPDNAPPHYWPTLIREIKMLPALNEDAYLHLDPIF